MIKGNQVEKQKYLYHYTNENVLANNIADNDLIKFGNIKNTNDPKEAFPPNIGIGGPLGFCMTIAELNEMVYQELKKYKILCFCTDSWDESEKNRGFYYPRMWAGYANNHKGCCIVLDRQEFEKELEKRKYIWQGKAVTYCAQSSILYFENCNLPTNDDIKKFVENNIDYLLFSKSPDWKNENEYRYIIYSDSDDIYACIKKSLVGIIFGYKFPISIYEFMLEHYDNVETTTLTWSNGVPSYCEIYNSYYDYLFKTLSVRLIFYIHFLLNGIKAKHITGGYDLKMVIEEFEGNSNIGIDAKNILKKAYELLNSKKTTLGELYEFRRKLNTIYDSIESTT